MKNLIFRLTHITGTILAFFLIGTVTTVQGQDSETNEKAIVRSADNDKLEWGPCPAFMGDGCNITVLHGNPEEPNADILFRMKGNTSVPRHWHNSPERMVLISGKMRVNYDGQEAEVLQAGDYAYGPTERPHTATCLSDDPCVLFIAFEDPIDAMPGAKTED
ncbi:cupin domain-containing protein [Pricia sp. S334]|uniref:Cupin domain-containing protein n=1 Tax=Pricia mediterranea TaxID=3076079 RepID=A0ABU3LAL2_9FLAO|nr:cupin domain-containing protein [Pricia sp. S334]MDT7830428.1 cupin domain-containing protein [Pricia sp. S334]